MTGLLLLLLALVSAMGVALLALAAILAFEFWPRTERKRHAHEARAPQPIADEALWVAFAPSAEPEAASEEPVSQPTRTGR